LSGSGVWELHGEALAAVRGFRKRRGRRAGMLHMVGTICQVARWEPELRIGTIA
jgi:hypothetical protein